MSIWVTNALRCDEESCTAEFPVWINESVVLARLRAREAGWVSWLGQLDRCPAHRVSTSE